MEHRLLKSVAAFLLTLALTAGAVAALSMATEAKSGTAPARYVQEVQENQTSISATELSASIPEEKVPSLASAGAFALILSIPAAGVYLFFRARKQGRKVEKQQGSRYSPKADRSFRVSVRTRV